MFVLVIPYFFMIELGATWLYFMQVSLLGIIWASIFATQGTLFSELFPAKARYTGLSFGYQMAAAIVGFGPKMWATMAGLAISLILSLFTPKTKMNHNMTITLKKLGKVLEIYRNSK
jgi:hypothetical protein